MIRRRRRLRPLAFCCAALVVFVAVTAFTSAEFQPATAPAEVEPGQAEVRVTHRSIEGEVRFTQPAVEARGVWVPSNDLLGPRDAMLRKFDQLKRANFNTVLIDAWFRGYTAYAGSAVAPLHPDLKGGDAFGAALAEAKLRGLRVEPWISYGFYAYFTPDATKDRSLGPVLSSHPELASIDARGNRSIHRAFGDYYSLCPANPRSHEVLGRLMVEVVAKYPVDGLHLDRIRFAEADHCFCNYCKAGFLKDAGLELKRFENGSDEHEKWTQWKRQQTLAAMRHFRRVVHAARPGLPITSYVVGPDEMDARGQSWDLWAREGLLDAVAVSMYGADIRPAAEKALARLGEAGRSRLICALSADRIPTPIFAANVQVARQYAPLGQFTWYLGRLDEIDLEALHDGPYARPAKDPLAK